MLLHFAKILSLFFCCWLYKLFVIFFVLFQTEILSDLELGKPEGRRVPYRRVNGIFWILLLNIGIFAADHLFQVLQKFQSHFLIFLWQCNLFETFC